MIFEAVCKPLLHDLILFDSCCLAPLSAIFQVFHGDHFVMEEAGVPERTTNHGQVTGKLYHLLLRVECTLFYRYM